MCRWATRSPGLGLNHPGSDRPSTRGVVYMPALPLVPQHGAASGAANRPDRRDDRVPPGSARRATYSPPEAPIKRRRIRRLARARPTPSCWWPGSGCAARPAKGGCSAGPRERALVNSRSRSTPANSRDGSAAVRMKVAPGPPARDRRPGKPEGRRRAVSSPHATIQARG